MRLQMTSMIDIVFLLLVFFIMTFKIVESEGDFNIRMPSQGEPVASSTDLPLKLRMVSDSSGNLSGMRLNTKPLGTDFGLLRSEVVGLMQNAAGPASEDSADRVIEIDADFQLRYDYTIQAITAVTGQKRGNSTQKLIERVKFAPTR